jgi:L-fuculose-phosphate aldolase
MTETPLTQMPETRSLNGCESAAMKNTARCEEKLRAELAGCSGDLHALGFAPGTSGNVSVRLDGSRVLATPTGCSKRVVGPEDLVVVDMSGQQLAGTRHVTSEIDMHLAIYKARADVEAVVHAHPVFATAFASSGLALDQPLCSEVVMTLGSIPLAAYATTGTCEVRQTLAPYLEHHDAVLLANHGVVTYGESLMDALMKMETVEHFAQICLVVRQLGGGATLEGKHLTDLLQARAAYLQKAGRRVHWGNGSNGVNGTNGTNGTNPGPQLTARI